MSWTATLAVQLIGERGRITCEEWRLANELDPTYRQICALPETHDCPPDEQHGRRFTV